jgi:hypothetical protein
VERTETLLKIVQSAVTTAAILAAGAWFLMQGEAEARANISHEVTHRPLDDRWTWVGLSVTVENAGNRRLDLERGIVRIQQVLPLDAALAGKLAAGESLMDGTAIPWPRIGESYELELHNQIQPKESDSSFHYDFVVPSNVRTVRLYSYFEQRADPPLGWGHATFYDIRDGGTSFP